MRNRQLDEFGKGPRSVTGSFDRPPTIPSARLAWPASRPSLGRAALGNGGHPPHTSGVVGACFSVTGQRHGARRSPAQKSGWFALSLRLPFSELPEGRFTLQCPDGFSLQAVHGDPRTLVVTSKSTTVRSGPADEFAEVGCPRWLPHEERNFQNDEVCYHG